MTKNDLKKALKKVTKIKTWQILLILIPVLFAYASFLRLDHLAYIDLRDNLIEADASSATQEELLEKLSELKQFVFSHTVVNFIELNGEQKLVFGTGPLYLEQQYINKAQEEIAKVEQELSGSAVNVDIYNKSAAICDALAKKYGWRSWSSQHTNCVLTELKKYPEITEINNMATALIPSTLLYYHNYASPIWSPSLSGLFALISLILIIMIFIRFFIWLTLKITLVFLKKR